MARVGLERNVEGFAVFIFVVVLVCVGFHSSVFVVILIFLHELVLSALMLPVLLKLRVLVLFLHVFLHFILHLYFILVLPNLLLLLLLLGVFTIIDPQIQLSLSRRSEITSRQGIPVRDRVARAFN